MAQTNQTNPMRVGQRVVFDKIECTVESLQGSMHIDLRMPSGDVLCDVSINDDKLSTGANEMTTVHIPENTHGFPIGVSVDIETRDGSKYVTINARLHMRKHKELPHCYAESFSTDQILRDGDFLKYLAAYR
jgi:hypothetical protein